jgi:DNA repair protein RecN (Recombination protein N)
VGEKLAAVGDGRQVLCVTHQAPIAALAEQHVRVAKSVRGGRTSASAAVIAGDERVTELARMLDGDVTGGVGLEHARALLHARGSARGRGAQRARGAQAPRGRGV